MDWAKKITKACAGDLQADEQIEAGVYVQPAGAMGRHMGSELGGLVGMVAITRNQQKKRDAMELKTNIGIGAQVGDKPHVVGLTSRRFLVWGHSKLSGKPKGLVLAVPLDALESLSYEKGKLLTKMVMEFNDGSAAIVDAAKLGDPSNFIETYQRLTGS